MSKPRSPLGRSGSQPIDATNNTLLAINAAIGEKLLSLPVDPMAPRLVVERAPMPIAPARMAALHKGPQAERLQVRTMYEQHLATFRAHVRPDDTAQGVDDAGYAVACFVATCLGTVTGTDMPAATLDRIERQLVELVRHISNWDRATVGQRQFYFEQMAMLGVTVALRTAAARKGNADDLRAMQKVAHDYLRHLLGVDPGRLAFGTQGIELRPAGATRNA